MRGLAEQLGTARDGALAVYFADDDEWRVWVGDALVGRFAGRTGTAAELTADGSMHEAKEAFLAAAQARAKEELAEQVRAAAHALLERYGCTVETARDGTEAASMVRACGAEVYDVIIADIRLPDMSGYELLLRLRELRDSVPLVLMTGFGYDPGHSIVKARQAGIDLVLFKPFRVDQLLDTVEKSVLRRGAPAVGR